MKTTQTTSLQPGFITIPGEADLAGIRQDRPAQRRATVGSGTITTPAVAAHMRSQMGDSDLRAAETRPVQRRAAMGSGTITTPAVAAHMRKSMECTRPRSI